jgi:hypothetical protein
LFNNHLDVFEHKLVLQYFKYSGQVLRLDYQYADWVIDFRRKYRPVNTSNRALLTSYLENRVMAEEELSDDMIPKLYLFPLERAL